MPSDNEVKVGSFLIALIAGLGYVFLPAEVVRSGDVVPVAGLDINITAIVLNAPCTIVSVDAPEAIEYGQNFDVNFTVRDNNTLADLGNFSAEIWRPDLEQWEVYGSVSGPYDVVTGGPYNLPYMGTYTANYNGIPDYGQNDVTVRVSVEDGQNRSEMTRTVLFTGYLMIDVLSGGEEIFEGLPGSVNEHEVVLQISSNVNRDLLCFYPGNMSVWVNGSKVGNVPQTVMSLTGGSVQVRFTIKIEVPNPYLDDRYSEKVYFMVEL